MMVRFLMCLTCISSSNTTEADFSKDNAQNQIGGDTIVEHTPGAVNLADSVEGTVKWSNNTIDVSFATPAIDGVGPYNGTDWFSNAAGNAVLQALILIQNVCNIEFNVLNAADITADLLFWESNSGEGWLGVAEHGGNGGGTSAGNTGDTYCDVVVDYTNHGNYEGNLNNGYNGMGSDAFVTWIHEIGHALGLGHTHDTGFGSLKLNNTNPYEAGASGLNYGFNSVMSYNHYNDGLGVKQGAENSNTGHAVIGAWDIHALQEMYGVNEDYNSGNNTYRIDDFKFGWQCIWDAGGKDTISHANKKSACHIDLNDATLDATAYSGGGLSYTSTKNYGVTIANNVVIENAIGGKKNDTIVGNSASNQLIGGAGNDIIYGLGGSDKITGGIGTDKLYAGIDGNKDTFYFSSITETKKGNKHDTIYQFDTNNEDIIDLRSIDANSRKKGNQDFNFSNKANKYSIWVVKKGDNYLVRGDVNGNKKHDFEIQLNDVDSLSASDFVL